MKKNLWYTVLRILSISVGITLLAFTVASQKYPFLDKITQQLTAYWEHTAPESVYVQLDRTWYKPGESVWLNAFVRSANTLQASSKSDILYVELYNPKGARIKQLRLMVEAGAAQGDFTIPSSARGGIYKIKAYTQWQKNEQTIFEKDLQVQAAVLPKLKMKLDFERKAFGPGSEVVATLELQSLSNEALANQDFKFVVQLKGKRLLQKKATTDGLGNASLQFQLPQDLQTTDALLNVMLNHQGQQESIARAIPIVLNDIDLQFLPEGGIAVADVKSRFGFKAINEFGKPADVAGVIYNEKEERIADFKSFHQGMGAVNFKPLAGVSYYAKITSPAALDKKYVLPLAEPKAYALAINKIKPKGVSLTINNKQAKATVFLVAQMGGEVVFKEAYQLFGSPKKVFIPTRKLSIGTLQISLFDSQEKLCSERLVFINKQKQLKLEIKTDKDKYLPREEVKMQVKVRDEKGKPVRGNFALAVVDDQLLSFADDKQAQLLASLLLESELKTKVEEPNFYFDPTEEKADQALDFLMMTQGWRGRVWQVVQSGHLPTMAYQNEALGLRGKIMDIMGNPIPNASITLLEPFLRSHSKQNGEFQLPIKDYSYESQLVVAAPGYESEYLRVSDYLRRINLRLKKTNWTLTQRSSAVGKIRGKVHDQSSGESLPFVNVIVNQNGQFVAGTQTDFDGDYQIKIPEHITGTLALQCNFVGMNTVVVPLQHFTPRTSYTIDLQMSSGVSLSDISVMRTNTVITENTISAVELDLVTNAGVVDQPERPIPLETVIEEVEEEIVAVEELAEASAVEEEPKEDIEPRAELAPVEKFKEAKDRRPPALSSGSPPPPPPPIQEEIFRVAEKMPRYYSALCEDLPTEEERKQCAQASMLAAVYQRVKYPQEARRKGIAGTVVVSFTVDKTGAIKDLKLARDIGGGCGVAAMEAIAGNLRKFVPGTQRGRPVAVRYNLPVKFRLDNHSGTTKGQSLPAAHRRKAQLPFYQAKTFYTPKYTVKDRETQQRSDFRSTIYWNPSLSLDEKGEAIVRFYTSDAITAFRATVEGLSHAGGLGSATTQFYTQKAFNLFAKLPTRVLTGDQLSIPVTLVNNTDQRLRGNLQVEAPDNLEPSDKRKPKALSLKPFAETTVYLNYQVKDQPGEAQLKIAFAANGISDELVHPLRTVSRGFPIAENRVGNRTLQQNFEFELQAPIEGSVEAKIQLFPSVLGEVITGMEKMLRHPGGCFEQTSSSNYPNLLVLDYLREHQLSEAKIEARAKQYLAAGYERLTGFEASTGGFEWYGRNPGHEALTAYGILQFVDMSRVFPVDQAMIQRNAKWLLARRDGKGAWLSNGSHGWYVNNAIGGAYVVWALCEAGFASELTKEIERSYQDALKSEDPYLMALVANTLFKIEDPRANALLNDLLSRQAKNGSWMGLQQSAMRSRGNGLRVETTAMVALAMAKSGKTGPILDRAIQFIKSAKNNYGFGNTQSTILALKALLAYVGANKSTAESGKVAVKVNGKKLKLLSYAKGQRGVIELNDLAAYFSDEGKQKVSVQFLETKQPIDVELSVKYASRQPASHEACRLGLTTALQQRKVKMGETLRFTGTITNLTQENLASPIAIIGIPAGLSVQAWQLKAMQERNEMAYYEIFDDQLVFYYDQLPAAGKKEIRLDLKADIPGTYEAPASSVYEYYQNEWQRWSKPTAVVIRP